MRLFVSPIEVLDLWAEFVSREWCLCDWPNKASYGGMMHDVWIAQVDGVLPSWDGVLILDNWVQTPCCDAEMKMPIFLLDSSFEEVHDRSKDHLDPMSRTFILNLFKIYAGPSEGFVPQQLCHTPSLMDINWSTLEEIFTHHILTYFSLIIWLVWSPWRLFSSHVGNFSKEKNYVFGLGFTTTLTLVNAWSNWPETLPNFRFFKSAFFGTIPEAGCWLWLGCVDLAAAVVCDDRWLTALTFVDFWGWLIWMS